MNSTGSMTTRKVDINFFVKINERMKEIVARQKGVHRSDWENDHVAADDLLCEALENLGYEAREIVKTYNSIYKWHA